MNQRRGGMLHGAVVRGQQLCRRRRDVGACVTDDDRLWPVESELTHGASGDLRRESLVPDEPFEHHGTHPARLRDARPRVGLAEVRRQRPACPARDHRIGATEPRARRVCRRGYGAGAPTQSNTHSQPSHHECSGRQRHDRRSHRA